ncbi:CGNR zinc finger domain-containing protein [Mycolicibacterium sp. P9-64]|uniref:CGNR zinc finger domain-containing protein n=1 Tax=Mycolicibacterium sp. P9-64 TaxID=2024612 RepID=UPI001F5BFC4B|nr:CGNR zinc finger domain-containing protein [Mycolicibacterium sp. P9-64]
MEGFGYPATSRFGTATLAPAPLVLSQELANTIGLSHLPQFVDLLGQVDSAQQWIDSVVPRWCTSFGADDPRLLVTEAELPRLRAVRDTLRAVLGGAGASEATGNGTGASEATGEVSGASEATGNVQRDPETDAVISGTAEIRVTASGAHLEPHGSGADWLASAISIEAAAAHAQDTFRRLKLCHETHCRTALYDRSKNNSRVWHDTATCGNKTNARAHRERRRAIARDDSSQ